MINFRLDISTFFNMGKTDADADAGAGADANANADDADGWCCVMLFDGNDDDDGL